MKAHLICVHTFRESSLESLREAVDGNDLGKLLYAVKIVGLTDVEIQAIYTKNWIAADDASLPKYQGFNMHPFVEKVEIDCGINEFYVSEANLFTFDTAYKLWDTVEIATALAAFERWLLGSVPPTPHLTSRPAASARCSTVLWKKRKSLRRPSVKAKKNAARSCRINRKR